jgi:hypothetical protein
MEFKTYREIDLNETPIAVLGCGHFFTGETLDGMVGMSNVYITDKFGSYNGLQALSGELTAVPTCPDCRVPIRQFATRRYNRVVNKAVLDETSKRFLVGGREKLAELEKRVAAAEKEVFESRHSASEVFEVLGKLEKEAARLRKDMDAEHQPTKKLFDAVITFKRAQREQPLSEHLQNLTLSEPTEVPKPVYDQQITLNAHRLQLRIQEAILRDNFTLLSKRAGGPLALSVILNRRCAWFLHHCQGLITAATSAKLPRLVIPTILSYARIAQLDGWYRAVATAAATTDIQPKNEPTNETTEESPAEKARSLLTHALTLCSTIPGQDGDAYRAEVEETAKLFAETRYEEVTPAEIAAIKSAMVSGAGGLATHAGHWYTCRNGHPVSFLFLFLSLSSHTPPRSPSRGYLRGGWLAGWLLCGCLTLGERH